MLFRSGLPGRLPHGTPGDFTFTELSRGVALFAAQTAPYLGAERLEPLDVRLGIGDFHLTGTIDSLFGDRHLRYRYASIKPKDHLGAWIPHLVLNCLAEPGYPRESLLIGLEKGAFHPVQYGAVEESREILSRLLDLYWRGLVKPLRFFAASAFDYLQTLQVKQKTREQALDAARLTWKGNDHKRGEIEDPYLDLCFRSVDPLDADFEAIAREVFEPLLRCMREVSDDA